jgi:hypothetical protein
MILLYIYLGICLLTMVSFALTCINAAYEFRRRYPHIKIPKSYWADKVLTAIKVVTVSVTPILNLCLLYAVLIKSNELTESSIQDLYKKYSTEGEQNEEEN